jgi:hypothetical protein
MRFILLLIVFTLIFPAQLFAAPPPDPPETPVVMGIDKGVPAPYSGVLLNSLAAAQLFAEKDYSSEECKLRINFAVQKEFARMSLLLDSLKATNDSLEKRYDAIITIKDTEIERLSALAVGQKDYSQWWAAGGVVVGIALTLAVVYGVKEMQ